MEKVKVAIIDDNEKFRAVLSFLFLKNKAYEVIALLTHDDVLKTDMLREATVAIVAVRSTHDKTFETVGFIKEKYPLKILAMPLHIKDVLVHKMRNATKKSCLTQQKSKAVVLT